MRNDEYFKLKSGRDLLQKKIESDIKIYREWIKDRGLPVSEKEEEKEADIRGTECGRGWKYHQYLEILMNDLAVQWDERINRIRAEKGYKGLCSEHRFSIVNDHNRPSPVFQKYSQLLPPDERVGFIFCSLNWRKRMIIMSILHEMGHSIGKRERTYRYDNVFLPMLAERIVFEVAGRMNGLMDVDISGAMIRKPMREKNPEMERTVRIIYSLLSWLEEQIRAKMSQARSEFSEIIEKEISDNMQDAASEDSVQLNSILKRQKLATEMKFFVSSRGLLLETLSNLFETDGGEGSFYTELKEKLIQGLLGQQSEETEKTLKNCLKAMSDECIKARDEGVLPIWYRDAEEVLEETVADIFMLRICYEAPPSDLYCKLLLNCLQKRISDEEPDVLTKQAAMPSNLLRILAVWHAMENHTKKSRKNAWRSYEGFRNLVYKTERSFCDLLYFFKWLQRADALDYLQEQYCNMERYLVADNSVPVILKDEYYHFCYSPKMISRYLDYVDMIWRSYDQIFDEYGTNQAFMCPIEQIRREMLNCPGWKKRRRYLSKKMITR